MSVRRAWLIAPRRVSAKTHPVDTRACATMASTEFTANVSILIKQLCYETVIFIYLYTVFITRLFNIHYTPKR